MAVVKRRTPPKTAKKPAKRRKNTKDSAGTSRSVAKSATTVPHAAVLPKLDTKGWGTQISDAKARVVVSEVRTQAGPTRRMAVSTARSLVIRCSSRYLSLANSFSLIS